MLIFIFASKGSPASEEAASITATQTEGGQQQQQQQEVVTSQIPGVLYKVNGQILIARSSSSFPFKCIVTLQCRHIYCVPAH